MKIGCAYDQKILEVFAVSIIDIQSNVCKVDGNENKLDKKEIRCNKYRDPGLLEKI